MLTDYRHWPELFEVRMRLVDLQIRQDVVTTDLRIEHALMPGERRLVTESRATANEGIVTDLVEGDFKRYHRVWKLSPANEGRETYRRLRTDGRHRFHRAGLVGGHGDQARTRSAFSDREGKGARPCG